MNEANHSAFNHDYINSSQVSKIYDNPPYAYSSSDVPKRFLPFLGTYASCGSQNGRGLNKHLLYYYDRQTFNNMSGLNTRFGPAQGEVLHIRIGSNHLHVSVD